jgi:FtsP/CotA-like multicopper oxidase with cupredoxin domain
MNEHRALAPPRRHPAAERLGAAALSVALFATLGGCTPTAAPARPAAAGVQAPRPAVTQFADSLTEPLVVRSVNGVLNATLDVTMANLPVTRAGKAIIGDTVSVTNTVQVDTLPLRAYTLAATTDPAYRPDDPRFTPRFPGPTFRVRPGDLVQIWLRNKLPPLTGRDSSNNVCMSYPAADADPAIDQFQDCFHGPNFTNIHYHGMHVTPDSSSTAVGDDVLMVIAPGDSVLYSFRIPTNQSPGTHWYHPHKHGSVALQVANGMAGAFIVEDPTTGLDWFTQQFGLRERLIAVQQVDTAVGLLHGDKTNMLDKVPPLVNGQDYPTIYMAPGEMQRWRIVNENVTSNTKTLEFNFHDREGPEPVMVEVARDGVSFDPANLVVDTDSTLLMAAGNRLDVIVMAPPSPGEHLLRVRHNPGASRRSRDPVLPLRTLADAHPDSQQIAVENSVFLVFRVVVDENWRGGGTGLPTSIPDLAEFLGSRIRSPSPFLAVNLAPARDTAVIVFTDIGGPGSYLTPTQFFLGSAQDPTQRFNDTVVFVPSSAGGTPMPMYLDSTQTWEIVNNSPNGINHPFHIHINPFQVDSVYAPAGTADPFYALYQELNAAARRGSPIWLDVIPLPSPSVDANGHVIVNAAREPLDPGVVFITQRYDRFAGCSDGKCGSPVGEFVMHCHILGHEERGMMQVLQVTEKGQPRARLRGHGTHYPAPGTGQERRGGGNGQGQGQQNPQAQQHRH